MAARAKKERKTGWRNADQSDFCFLKDVFTRAVFQRVTRVAERNTCIVEPRGCLTSGGVIPCRWARAIIVLPFRLLLLLFESSKRFWCVALFAWYLAPIQFQPCNVPAYVPNYTIGRSNRVNRYNIVKGNNWYNKFLKKPENTKNNFFVNNKSELTKLEIWILNTSEHSKLCLNTYPKTRTEIKVRGKERWKQ